MKLIDNINQKWENTSIPSLQKIERKWFCIDLKNKVMGRAAVVIANLLRGKNDRLYTPNLDLGNNVVVLNAKYIKFTGKNKLEDKCYYDYSNYPGGLRSRTTKQMLKDYNIELVRRIVKGMIPHNNMGRKQIKRLFIFLEDKHQLIAQEKYFIKIKI